MGLNGHLNHAVLIFEIFILFSNFHIIRLILSKIDFTPAFQQQPQTQHYTISYF